MKLYMMRELSRRFGPPRSREEAEKLRDILLAEGYSFDNFYQEMEMSFPLVEAHRDESWSNTATTLHSHDFYELLYVQSSDGAQYLVGSQRYRLRQGDVLLVAPGVSHRPLLPETMAAPYRRIIFWLSREFAAQAPRMLPGIRLPGPEEELTFLRTLGTPWEDIQDLFLAGVAEAEAGQPGWEGMVLGYAILIMARLGRAMSLAGEGGWPTPPAEKPELLERVMAYIEGNLSQHITLDATARQFYVSQSTVSHLFRQKMGVSFYRCVTQRRLIAAKSLIAQDQPLEHVSRQVGFSDYSSFYRAFKAEYGISPRQFKHTTLPREP